MTPESVNAAARRRKLFLMADEIGLSRDERIELAQVVLRRDITSWGNLDDAQVLRLLDCCEGYDKIRFLIASR